MDFNEPIDRKNTGSVKWDMSESIFGSQDILPMWLADMDFSISPSIKDSLHKLIDSQIPGYSFPENSLYEAIIKWQKNHHDMTLTREDILFSPGVLTSIAVAIQSLTDIGDGILIHDPVYTPFSTMITNNNRQLYTSKLILQNNQYNMDFENIENQMKEYSIKLFILSNPHNPGGRVWSSEELTKLTDLCIHYNIVLISDEIHSDLVYDPLKCISPVTINESYKNWVITFHSATKTFNIAGSKSSYIIVYNPTLKNKLVATQHQSEVDSINNYGLCALEAALTDSIDWYTELMIYLTFNRNYIIDYFTKNLPEVIFMIPEATYLFWFDASTTSISPSKLKETFATLGKIGLNDGISYGENGASYMRLNFAVPLPVLQESLKRIKHVFDSLK